MNKKLINRINENIIKDYKYKLKDFIGIQSSYYNRVEEPYLILANDKNSSTRGYYINELYKGKLFNYSDSLKIMELLNHQQGLKNLHPFYNSFPTTLQKINYNISKRLQN